MIHARSEIENGLNESLGAVIDWIANQPDDRFEWAPPEKWSAGQHLEHLLRSVEPINMVLRLPKLMIRWRFGKPEGPARSFDEVVARYQDALAKGGAASGRFVPPEVPVARKPELLQKYRSEKERLAPGLGKWSEAKLDRYVVPHPLIGKLTIREILFFTIYHNRHHLNTLQTHY